VAWHPTSFDKESTESALAGGVEMSSWGASISAVGVPDADDPLWDSRCATPEARPGFSSLICGYSSLPVAAPNVRASGRQAANSTSN
jgi:hypothetical protein